jgi:hypothetical protein
MPDIHLDLRLRPLRVGLLVRPNDRKSILTFMRACTCVWGGMYNPIIPIFKTCPREWKLEPHEPYKASDITKGYIRFFEPDVYVEAQTGLLEEAGLGTLREEHTFEPRVIGLDQFVAPQKDRDWAETLFGVDIVDVIFDLYQSEGRFQRRHESLSYIVQPDKIDGLVEAVFGQYPNNKSTAHIRQNYSDAFDAVDAGANP